MSSQDERWLLEEKYQGEKSEAYFADVKRLQAGEPLAYVIGHIPFLGFTIHLDSRPLIPRPETEYWVEKAISFMQEKGGDLKVLDLCAGSGCIGVAVAKALSNTLVDFVEIDERHHSTIQKNIISNEIDFRRTRVFGGDLMFEIEDKYDFILSNPPYIDPSLDRTESSVKNHEPSLALYGGQQGLEIVIKIISSAPSHLNKRGQLWIEHEPEQVEAIQKLGTEAGFSNIEGFRDQYNQFRYSVLVY